MAKKLKSPNSVSRLVDESLALVAEATKGDPQAAKTVRTAAAKAAETFKKTKAAQQAELRKALKSAESMNVEAMDRAFLTLARTRGGGGCPGAECAFACSIGCIVGCGVTGGATVAFGALGGTAGGAGTGIATT